MSNSCYRCIPRISFRCKRFIVDGGIHFSNEINDENHARSFVSLNSGRVKDLVLTPDLQEIVNEGNCVSHVLTAQ